jgi:hypothetical protein
MMAWSKGKDAALQKLRCWFDSSRYLPERTNTRKYDRYMTGFYITFYGKKETHWGGNITASWHGKHLQWKFSFPKIYLPELP